MSTAQPLVALHHSTVTDDRIDELGHMNVRWYAHDAFAATAAMIEQLGLPAATRVVSAYTRHHHEQLVTNQLEVRGAVLAGTDRLRLYHELRNAADGELGATFVHELDHPMIEARSVELPEHGLPRSVDLAADGVANAPTLSTARADGLELRHPRTVDATDDARGTGTVPAWNAMALFWGGDPFGDDNEWIRTTPTGLRFATATMEARLWSVSLPAAGARIQSFAAPISVADKVSHHVHWAFELERGELLAVLETVHLAFDVDARRAIAIPDDSRRQMTDRLRPDLAPA